MPEAIISDTDVFDQGQSVRLVRSTLERRRPKALHGHTFYELIWVQNGRVRHHLPDGREDLNEGDLIFVGPGHSHAIQGLGDAPFVVTVVFSKALIDELGARHPAIKGIGFWAQGRNPARVHREPRQLAELNQTAMRLERGRQDGLEGEAFLLPLISQIAGPGRALPSDAPDWLTRACEAARDPEVFRQGAAGFVRITGKAHPHVSRTARQVLGRSPTDYVNEQRMAFAGRRLTSTDDSLAEIAAECGIPNLSHFHKLFRATYATTPQKYRASRQRTLVQPD